MSESIVEVRDLSHRYSVDWAIRGINFSIDRRGIMGLLGSNGAGKSTTMNIICGVLNQTEGSVLIEGVDLREDPVAAKRNIGFLPQKPPLHPDLTVYEYLVHCAELRRMGRRDVAAAVERAMELCQIAHFRKRIIKHLSGGYQQRVGIAQAIVHSPRFVVLDEPTNGLDPNQILEVRNLIKDIAEERTVLLSTHILSEVQAVCDRILMIEHGAMRFSGTMDDFNSLIAPDTFSMTFSEPVDPALIGSLAGVERVDDLGEGHYRVRFAGDEQITARMIAHVGAQGLPLREITLERPSLESIFAHLSGRSKSEKQGAL
jgi:ABC-2 type transport system ATP-binding protein